MNNLRKSLNNWVNGSYIAPLVVYLFFLSSIIMNIGLVFPSFTVYQKIKIIFDFIVSKSFTDFLKIIIWPFVILCSFYIFRKVFTYLFISVEELNIFGTKFKIKSPKEVILEQAEIKFQNLKEEEARSKEREETSQKIEDLQRLTSLYETENSSKTESIEFYKKQAKDYEEYYNKAIKIAQDLSTAYKDFIEKSANGLDRIIDVPELESNEDVVSESDTLMNNESTSKNMDMVDESSKIK